MNWKWIATFQQIRGDGNLEDNENNVDPSTFRLLYINQTLQDTLKLVYSVLEVTYYCLLNSNLYSNY